MKDNILGQQCIWCWNAGGGEAPRLKQQALVDVDRCNSVPSCLPDLEVCFNARVVYSRQSYLFHIGQGVPT